MYPRDSYAMRPGISAVLAASANQSELEPTVLELVAVLDGLVGGNFEIIVVGAARDALTALLTSSPKLPLRILDSPHSDLADGIGAATYDLVFAVGAQAVLDVRELNHFLEAIEDGADLVVGYRPNSLRRFAWSAVGRAVFGPTARDVECPFKLFRRAAWQRLGMDEHSADRWFNTRLLVRARRYGYRVTELPVRRVRRPPVVPLADVPGGTTARAPVSARR